MFVYQYLLLASDETYEGSGKVETLIHYKKRICQPGPRIYPNYQRIPFLTRFAHALRVPGVL